MNSIRVIRPYRYGEAWVFDDPAVGLDKEPFVSGIDDLIDQATASIPNAKSGFTMLFSDQAFPGSSLRLEWRREEMDGNWYYSPDFGTEGWLCPALFKYFDKAPAEIFIQMRPAAAPEPGSRT